MGIGGPELLVSQHRIADFHCSEPSLDEWLERKTLKNQTSGVSWTFIICKSNSKQLGVYPLEIQTNTLLLL